MVHVLVGIKVENMRHAIAALDHAGERASGSSQNDLSFRHSRLGSYILALQTAAHIQEQAINVLIGPQIKHMDKTICDCPEARESASRCWRPPGAG